MALPSAAFGNMNILWCNLSGSFVSGLDGPCPIRAVACLDDEQDLDLIEARSGVRFLSHERSTRRREVAHDPANDDIIRHLREPILNTLAASPKSTWRIVCPRPARALEEFAAETGYTAVSLRADLCHWLNHKNNFFQGRRELQFACPEGSLAHLADNLLPGTQLRIRQLVRRPATARHHWFRHRHRARRRRILGGRRSPGQQ